VSAPFLFAESASPIVVDTRPATAWSESRIPGALTIPSDDVAHRAPAILDDEDADIVLYSWGADDHTAATAAGRLTQDQPSAGAISLIAASPLSVRG
jgi:rhodanese-related sulfurtransferase